MPEQFNAYYEWLGIPPHIQRPNHYQLLSIQTFEGNPTVIENAADRQMAHLRSFQSGSRSAESQRLLNEVAAARVCLLNPQKKAFYDAQLRAAINPSPPAALPHPASLPHPAYQMPQSPTAAHSQPALSQALRGPGNVIESYVTESAGAAPRGVRSTTGRSRAARGQSSTLDGFKIYSIALLAVGVVGLAGILWVRANKWQIMLVEADTEADATQRAKPKKPAKPSPGPSNDPRAMRADAPDSGDENPREVKKVSKTAPRESSPDQADIQQGPPLAMDNKKRPNPAPVVPADPGKSPPGTLSATDLNQSDNSRAIDLLALIDLNRDRVAGDWNLQQGILTSPFTKTELRVQIPFVPPTDYVLTLAGEREAGADLIIGLVVGGKQTAVILDGWGRTISGVNRIDGKIANENETTCRLSNILGDRRKYIVECTVRSNHIRVVVNGTPLFNWQGNAQRLSNDECWFVPHRDQLFLGSFAAIHHISSIELVPLLLPAEDKTLDLVKLTLDQAKQVYQEEMQDYRNAAEEYFDKRKKDASKSRNRQFVQKAEAEHDAFRKWGTLPKTAVALKNRLATIRKKMDDAYVSAENDYSRTNASDALAAVRMDHEIFKDIRNSQAIAAIDLLKLIDIQRDTVKGRWSLFRGVLTASSPTDIEDRLQIPFVPPAEYILTVAGETEIGSELDIGLIIGGSQAMAVFDGWGRTASGIDMVDGREAKDNVTTRRIQNVIQERQPYKIVCTVRGGNLEATVNGQKVIDWSGAPNRLSMRPAWSVPRKDVLFVGTCAAIHHFSSITLVPLNAVVRSPPRRLWVQPHGYFIRGFGDDWFEKWDDGNKPANLFTQVNESPEYIELRHRHLPVTCRLSSTKAIMKSDSGPDYRLAYNGNWQTLTEAVGNGVVNSPRRAWVQPHGYFIRGIGADWFEKWNDGNKAANLFAQVSESPDFIEFRHRQVPVNCRLFPTRAIMKSDAEKEFSLKYEGGWQPFPGGAE